MCQEIRERNILKPNDYIESIFIFWKKKKMCCWSEYTYAIKKEYIYLEGQKNPKETEGINAFRYLRYADN